MTSSSTKTATTPPKPAHHKNKKRENPKISIDDPPSSPPSPAPAVANLIVGMDEEGEKGSTPQSRRVKIREPDYRHEGVDSLSSPPDKALKPKRSILKNVQSSPIKPSKLNFSLTVGSPQRLTAANSSPSARLAEDASSGHVNVLAYKREEVVNGSVQALMKNENPVHNTEYYNSINSVMRMMSPEKRRIFADIANNLAKCSKRDLQNAKSLSKTTQVQLVTIITKVVTLLLQTPTLVCNIDMDLGRWFIGNALDILENENSSKGFVASQIHLINWQKLEHPLTLDHGQRLLVIIGRGSRFRSASVITEFVNAHRLVLRYAPNAMLTHVPKWLPGIMEALQDRNTQIQNCAFKVICELRIKFAGNSEIGKSLDQWFASSPPPSPAPAAVEYKTNFDKLYAFMEEQSDHIYYIEMVMEIWSTIFSLMINWGNSPADLFDKSQFATKWLSLAYQQLDRPSQRSRCATIRNWNVVVYALASRPLNQYGAERRFIRDSHMAILLRPFETLKDADGTVAQSLTALFCLLLQAYMRPPSPQTSQLTTIVWDELLIKVFKIYSESPKRLADLNGILEELFMVKNSLSSAPIQAVVNRGEFLKNLYMPKVENTLPLGSKWIKLNPSRVLELFEIYFNVNWGLAKMSWYAYLGIIKLACSREVRVSVDTMQCIAGFCNFISNCWNSTTELKPIAQIIMSFVDTFDINILADKPLTIEDGKFVPSCNFTNTPSKRTGTSTGPARNPNRDLNALLQLWYIVQVFPKSALLHQREVHHLTMINEYIGFLLRHKDLNNKKSVSLVCDITGEIPDGNFVLWQSACKVLVSIKLLDGIDAEVFLKPLLKGIRLNPLESNTEDVSELWDTLLDLACRVSDRDDMFKASGLLYPLILELLKIDVKDSDAYQHYCCSVANAAIRYAKNESQGPLFSNSESGLNEKLFQLVDRSISMLPGKVQTTILFDLVVEQINNGILDNQSFKQMLSINLMKLSKYPVESGEDVPGELEKKEETIPLVFINSLKKLFTHCCTSPANNTDSGCQMERIVENKDLFCSWLCSDSYILAEVALEAWNQSWHDYLPGVEFDEEVTLALDSALGRFGKDAVTISDKKLKERLISKASVAEDVVESAGEYVSSQATTTSSVTTIPPSRDTFDSSGSSEVESHDPSDSQKVTAKDQEQIDKNRNESNEDGQNQTNEVSLEQMNKESHDQTDEVNQDETQLKVQKQTDKDNAAATKTTPVSTGKVRRSKRRSVTRPLQEADSQDDTQPVSAIRTRSATRMEAKKNKSQTKKKGKQGSPVAKHQKAEKESATSKDNSGSDRDHRSDSVMDDYTPSSRISEPEDATPESRQSKRQEKGDEKNRNQPEKKGKQEESDSASTSFESHEDSVEFESLPVSFSPKADKRMPMEPRPRRMFSWFKDSTETGKIHKSSSVNSSMSKRKRNSVQSDNKAQQAIAELNQSSSLPPTSPSKAQSIVSGVQSIFQRFSRSFRGEEDAESNAQTAEGHNMENGSGTIENDSGIRRKLSRTFSKASTRSSSRLERVTTESELESPVETNQEGEPDVKSTADAEKTVPAHETAAMKRKRSRREKRQAAKKRRSITSSESQIEQEAVDHNEDGQESSQSTDELVEVLGSLRNRIGSMSKQELFKVETKLMDALMQTRQAQLKTDE